MGMLSGGCQRKSLGHDVDVDLLETFNYLIGLTVRHIATPQNFQGAFQRDKEGRLRLDGRLKQDEAAPWWFRAVDGVTPDGRKTLVIWRKLTGDAERDNLVLDEWFTRQGYSTKDYEFDLIYVNGDNNLEESPAAGSDVEGAADRGDFHRLMFDARSVVVVPACSDGVATRADGAFARADGAAAPIGSVLAGLGMVPDSGAAAARATAATGIAAAVGIASAAGIPAAAGIAAAGIATAITGIAAARIAAAGTAAGRRAVVQVRGRQGRQFTGAVFDDDLVIGADGRDFVRQLRAIHLIGLAVGRVRRRRQGCGGRQRDRKCNRQYAGRSRARAWPVHR